MYKYTVTVLMQQDDIDNLKNFLLQKDRRVC
jgi:hypothetical protein